MKNIKQQYIRGKHNEVANGMDLVIQTAWPQLVGVVHRFGHTEQSEAKRLEFLSKVSNNPFYFAKANGYRIYVTLCCALCPIRESDVTGWNELLHQSLQEMAMFDITQITEGMRNNYADLG